MKPIDFWFSIGSTYTCLSVLRLPEVAAREGVEFNWRPFNVRSVLQAQNNIPFTGNPVKAAYMWRDIERRAQRYALDLRLPAPYPIEHLPLSNQVAVVGAEEGWVEPYVTEAYRLWFMEGLPAGSEPNLSRSIAAAGQDANRVIDRARGAAAVEALERATAEAVETGVFGAPSFVVDGEVFWGDDRLDDAIAWRRRGRLG